MTDISDIPSGRDIGLHLTLYVALAYDLLKTECIIIFFEKNIIFWMVNVRMFFIEEFNDFESALVYVKMDITLFQNRAYVFARILSRDILPQSNARL